VQGSAQVPLLSPTLPDSQQKPLEQLPLQHGVPPVLQVSPFGMHKVVVEVVLVEVEVVLVEKHVRGFGSRQSSVPPHPPQQSQGWPACLAAASGLTQRVSAAPRRQVPSALWGTWQILTVPGGQVIAAIALVEGISAARAVPAKSLSALRRLIDPSAKARARSSKERLVVSWLTCCLFFRRARH
jgi:hypothetical protein